MVSFPVSWLNPGTASVSLAVLVSLFFLKDVYCDSFLAAAGELVFFFFKPSSDSPSNV